MNIVCEKCATVYRIDASRIPAKGKKVKCSKCGHIFLARAPRDEDEVPTTEQGPDLAAELSEEVADLDVEPTDPGRKPPDSRPRKRLLLRQDGTRYAVSDLATLQRWIVERRVSREAELSEDGEVWEKVGERMDLLPFFGIVERTRRNRAARRRLAAAAGTAHPGAEAETPETDASEDPTVVARPVAGRAGEPGARSVPHPPPQAVKPKAREDTQETDAGQGTPPPLASAKPGRPPQTTPAAARPEVPAGNPIVVVAAIVAIVLLVVGTFVVKVRYIDARKNTASVATLSGTPSSAATAHQPPAPATTPRPAAAPTAPTPPPRASTPAMARPGTARTPTEEAPLQASPRPEQQASTPAPAQSASSTAPRATPPPAQPHTVTEVKNTASKPSATPRPAPASSPTRTTSSTSASRWISIGHTHLRNHRYDEAVEAFRRAVAKSPGSARTHKELGLGLLNLADVRYSKRTAYLEEAAREFSEAVRLDTGYAEAYHLLGVTYMQLDRKADAVKNLQLALSHGLSGDDATEARVFLQNLVDEMASETEAP